MAEKLEDWINGEVKELQSKIKSKFFGYISSETGNFSAYAPGYLFLKTFIPI